jgi:hypothetical protein
MNKATSMDKVLDPVIWNDLKFKLKQKYPVLTNADLLSRTGMEEDLFRMVAYKLGKTKKELQEIIDKL